MSATVGIQYLERSTKSSRDLKKSVKKERIKALLSNFWMSKKFVSTFSIFLLKNIQRDQILV